MRERPADPVYSRYAVNQTWTPTKPGSHMPPRTIMEIGPTQNALEGEIYYETATQGRSVPYSKWEGWVTRQKAVCPECNT
jgi:hypothetical protein